MHEKMTMAERFKETFSYKDVTVHFVGAWYVTPNLPLFWTPFPDDRIAGILSRLLGSRVVTTFFLGRSRA